MWIEKHLLILFCYVLSVLQSVNTYSIPKPKAISVHPKGFRLSIPGKKITTFELNKVVSDEPENFDLTHQ